MKEKSRNVIAKIIRDKSSMILIIISLALASSIYRSLARTNSAVEKVDEVRKSVEMLKKENDELGKKLAEMKNDEHIEKQLRDKLGLAQEGDVVLILPDDGVLRKIVTIIPEEEDTLPEANWVKWKKLFF